MFLLRINQSLQNSWNDVSTMYISACAALKVFKEYLTYSRRLLGIIQHACTVSIDHDFEEHGQQKTLQLSTYLQITTMIDLLPTIIMPIVAVSLVITSDCAGIVQQKKRGSFNDRQGTKQHLLHLITFMVLLYNSVRRF